MQVNLGWRTVERTPTEIRRRNPSQSAQDLKQRVPRTQRAHVHARTRAHAHTLVHFMLIHTVAHDDARAHDTHTPHVWPPSRSLNQECQGHQLATSFREAANESSRPSWHHHRVATPVLRSQHNGSTLGDAMTLGASRASQPKLSSAEARVDDNSLISHSVEQAGCEQLDPHTQSFTFVPVHFRWLSWLTSVELGVVVLGCPLRGNSSSQEQCETSDCVAFLLPKELPSPSSQERCRITLSVRALPSMVRVQKQRDPKTRPICG